MKKLRIILLLAVVAAFGYGLNQLFELRFEHGDVYPAYSSLRADPLGTKALYDSYGHLLSVQRNFLPFPKLEATRNTALFVLGLDPKDLRLSQIDARDLEHYVITGGRLIVSFYPVYQASQLLPRAAGPTAAGKPAKSPKNPDPEDEDDGKVSLSTRWKFGLEFAALERNEDQTYKPSTATKVEEMDLPETVSSHTALCFAKLDPSWTILYARTNDLPVLVERKFGIGSIVLAADSYWFSNEALLKERQPKLLAWFGASAQTAIFDETHLGVQENRGVAMLARKYRLHGFVVGLLMFAALAVWRYGFTLIPPYEEDLQREHGEWVTGKESAAGFTNLLRRNISARELLKICLEEWNKSCRKGVALPRLQNVQALIDGQNALPEKQRDPVGAYRRITEALRNKPAHRK